MELMLGQKVSGEFHQKGWYGKLISFYWSVIVYPPDKKNLLINFSLRVRRLVRGMNFLPNSFRLISSIRI
jgi:hypothetical protein